MLVQHQDLRNVLEHHFCVACGACLAVAPDLKLTLDERTLMYQPHAPGNALAASVCPAIQVDFAGLHRKLFPGQSITPHGVVQAVYVAQHPADRQPLASHSGSVVKELLCAALERREVDGVIALTHMHGVHFEPRLLTEPAEIQNIPETVTHHVPFDNALRILREQEGHFALVALPCQLEGLYTYIYAQAPWLAERLHTVIGITCNGTYSQHALRALCAYTHLDLRTIQDIRYRRGPVAQLRLTTAGKADAVVSWPTDFAYQVAFDHALKLPRCQLCVNPVNFLADIVVSDAWLPDARLSSHGGRLVICRTAQTHTRLLTLAAEGRLKLTTATPADITNAYTRDFAYAYADYLRARGKHCPQMEGPNRPQAKLFPPEHIAKFAQVWQRTQTLVQQGQYWNLWAWKAMHEIPRRAGPYLSLSLLRLEARLRKLKPLAVERLGLAPEPAPPVR
jgi:coenzyme F420-reducing hydrogenase beta subunit